MILLCFAALSGCSGTTSKRYICIFQPTEEIKIVKLSEGKETEIVIGSEIHAPEDLSVIQVMEYFYGLELMECK